MSMGLEVTGSGPSWAVVEGGTVLARRNSHDGAQLTLDRIRRARRITTRLCMCCGTAFKSTGPAHRLCAPCKREFA